MMEEEAELDLEEPDTSPSAITGPPLATSLQGSKDASSTELQADISSASVVGEITGHLEDEDLLDQPVLLTSSSRTTPLHSGTKETELSKDRMEKLNLNDIPIPGKQINTFDGFSMDNIDLSESHSSFSDLGYSLNTESESYDRIVAPADDSKSNQDDKENCAPSEPTKRGDSNQTEAPKENANQSKNKDAPHDISAYFQSMAVEDPFSLTATGKGSKSPGPAGSGNQANKANISSDSSHDTRSLQESAHGASVAQKPNPNTLKPSPPDSMQQVFSSEGSYLSLDNPQSVTPIRPTVPYPNDIFSTSNQAVNISSNPLNFQQTESLPADFKGENQIGNQGFTPVSASEAIPIQGQQHRIESGSQSQLSRDIQQAANEGVLLFTPGLPPQYQNPPLLPNPEVNNQSDTAAAPLQTFNNQEIHVSQHKAYLDQYYPELQYQGLAPAGAYIPLFVPSVYNYSSIPMYQPQIFTPARQDFSSHMTYSSSPAKKQDGPQGSCEYGARHEGGKEGLWSWVKQTVNADWAEGAQKIGKHLMEKTKHATDTVLTTLDPGMEEYLNPVINIAVASKNDDVVQGVRQGFRNIFGHSVVKGEDVQHGQAPLPVGFPSGTAAVFEKLNQLEKVSFPFQGGYVHVALEVFLTELEQQRWNAMFCLGVRDTGNGIDLRTFSQPIPLTPECVAIAFQKSNQQELMTGYGISISEAVRLAKPNSDQDWCYTMCGIPLQSIITVATQCLAADYKRHLEQGPAVTQPVQLQW